MLLITEAPESANTESETSLSLPIIFVSAVKSTMVNDSADRDDSADRIDRERQERVFTFGFCVTCIVFTFDFSVTQRTRARTPLGELNSKTRSSYLKDDFLAGRAFM